MMEKNTPAIYTIKVTLEYDYKIAGLAQSSVFFLARIAIWVNFSFKVVASSQFKGLE
jgi:hypothetical protein